MTHFFPPSQFSTLKILTCITLSRYEHPPPLPSLSETPFSSFNKPQQPTRPPNVNTHSSQSIPKPATVPLTVPLLTISSSSNNNHIPTIYNKPHNPPLHPLLPPLSPPPPHHHHPPQPLHSPNAQTTPQHQPHRLPNPRYLALHRRTP